MKKNAESPQSEQRNEREFSPVRRLLLGMRIQLSDDEEILRMVNHIDALRIELKKLRVYYFEALGFNSITAQIVASEGLSLKLPIEDGPNEAEKDEQITLIKHRMSETRANINALRLQIEERWAECPTKRIRILRSIGI